MQHLEHKNFVCSDVIDVKQCVDKLREDVRKLMPPNQKQKRCRDVVNLFGLKIDQKAFSELEETCSPQQFGAFEQTEDKSQLFRQWERKTGSNTAFRLESQKCKQRWESSLFKRSVISIPNERSDNDVENEDLRAHDCGLLLVRYYRPFVSSHSTMVCSIRYMQEIAILSHQTLADLRDKFKCVLDCGSAREMDYPTDATYVNMKNEYPSSFIFVENCFYNDMRDEKCLNYSDDIIEWAKQKKVGVYSSARMETTKLEDLKLRIGYPYVFQHQGNCQHLVVFTDIRLLRPEEPLASRCYPYVMSTNQFNTQLCMMCQQDYPKYIITEANRHLSPVNFFCKDCVLAYNYDANKQKIGAFKLYPYFTINQVLNEDDIIRLVDEDEGSE